MKFPRSLALAALAVCFAPLPTLASPTSGDLFFTTYSGSTNVNKTSYSYDGVTTFTLGAVTNIASTPGADGIIFAPDGDLIVGGQGNAVHKVDPGTGFFTTVTAGGTASYHVMLDPTGTQVYSAGIPGSLATIPLGPFAAGTAHTLSGDDLAITTIAFDTTGKAYYTASGSSGVGNFGTIDLTTYTTTRTMASVDAAHGMSFDAYTGKLVLFGSSHISQIALSDLTTLYSDFVSVGENFDQGSVDGKGHIFAASNFGNLLFMDYGASGKVGDVTNFSAKTFLAAALDDIAPLSGAGSQVPEPETLFLLPLGLVGLFLARGKRRVAG